MENILAKVLVADNNIIAEGTKELREAFKNPEVIPALCNVVGLSANPQIRQYAAVLLRKRLSKSKHWNKLSPEVKKGIKEGILQALVNEPEKFVKNAIAQFIGIIVKHEVVNSSWPEILHFIHQMTSSDMPADKELGMYTLSIISDITPESFESNLELFSFLFCKMFQDVPDKSSQIIYYTVITMIYILQISHGNDKMVEMYNALLPEVMQATRAMASHDDDKAIQMLELFDELVEFAGGKIISLHAEKLVHFHLEIASNKTIGDLVRVKAINFISWITRLKKKPLIKHKLIEPIIAVLFEIMSIPSDDDLEEDFDTDEDSSNLNAVATHTLDVLAIHLPPDKLLPPLLTHMEPGLTGNDIYKKKAAFLAMAIIAEGCTECIRVKYLKQFLQCICSGINDPSPIVRHVVLFALGQFSTHLQPDISEYASELLPLLFTHLSEMCIQLQTNTNKDPPGLDRIFYAVELFCENLGDELLPYLPTLMERVLSVLNTNHSISARQLAISCIGAIASAAKEAMLPYFPTIIENLKAYLKQESTEETLCLQVQAVDTLGVLGRTIGRDNFAPLASESLQLGLNLLNNTQDPDLRKSVYGLLAAIASVLREEMGAVMPTLVEIMLTSLSSEEGIVSHLKEDETSAYPVFEELSDSPGEEDIENESNSSDEDDDIAVENAYMEEKEEACLALRDFAAHCLVGFTPHLQQCFEQVFKIATYPHEDIRRAAIETLAQFCVCFSQIQNPEAMHKALSIFVPKCCELIRLDDERGVAMSGLEALQFLLKDIKEPVLLAPGHKEAIFNCIQAIMTFKTECQDKEDGEAEEAEAEQDELLIEYAGDIVPYFGAAMKPEEFAIYFATILPLFIQRTKSTCTIAQRSFAIGTVAESFSALGPEQIYQFIGQLLPLLINATRDGTDDVRSNAFFGLGELVFHGKQVLVPYFPEILTIFSEAAAREQAARTLDNICGALARLILVDINSLPISELFPVFVNYLPLREDVSENKWVFEAICHMYRLGHPLIQSHLVGIVKAATSVLGNKEVEEEIVELAKNFLRQARSDFPNEFDFAVHELGNEQASQLRQIF